MLANAELAQDFFILNQQNKRLVKALLEVRESRRENRLAIALPGKPRGPACNVGIVLEDGVDHIVGQAAVLPIILLGMTIFDRQAEHLIFVLP